MNSISVNTGTVCTICVAASVWNMAVAHDDLRQSYVNGAQAKVCYRVVDDTGVPVGNATAHVTFKSDGRPQDDFSGYVVTDPNGVFAAEHRPVFGEWCGYDLEVADWISPRGHGKYNSDKTDLEST